MAGQGLYRLCLQKIFNFLVKGIWNSCVPNPFSNIPPKIIKDLIATAESCSARMSDCLMLFTSGQLEEIDFSYLNSRETRYLLLAMLRENALRNLRYLNLLYFPWESTYTLLKAILQNSPKLERIYSLEFLNIRLLENCKNLKTLRFFSDFRNSFYHMREISLDYPDYLKKLEVFSPTLWDDCFSVCEMMETILSNCPNLTSVGMNDTSMAISNIAKESELPLRFQLRKCFWGFQSSITNDSTLRSYGKSKAEGISKLRPVISKMIKTAVSVCPYVEELIIDVFDEDCLQYLCELKQLNFLKMNFLHYRCRHKSRLFRFLSYIGSRIKHLSIDNCKHLPISAICDYFPNLESLQIIATSKARLNFENIKRLNISKIDRRNASFLISNCSHLTELYVEDMSCFDNEFLYGILRNNSLSDLKMLGISPCRLSYTGAKVLLRTVISLKIITFGRYNIYGEKMNRGGLKHVHIEKFYENEFFISKLHLLPGNF
ncbi:hypothetical protein AVEN_77156-1 [Araneus ventricosus]|uniref:F-box domain-containing protein n=1 Tax=Araneus ventricosus TaxID=182803 RepID=A0A4Y2IDH6_ARAVE|nr:hypothetical protein AVEN_77156-1 [Araneus ventricosus]